MTPLTLTPHELDELAHHAEAALPAAYGARLWWMGADLVAGADIFVTSRSVIDLEPGSEPSVSPHTHDVSQTYLFLGEPGALEVEVTIDSEDTVLVSPASVFIPAGVYHRLYLRRGTGTVVAILRDGGYS